MRIHNEIRRHDSYFMRLNFSCFLLFRISLRAAMFQNVSEPFENKESRNGFSGLLNAIVRPTVQAIIANKISYVVEYFVEYGRDEILRSAVVNALYGFNHIIIHRGSRVYF